MADVWKTYTDEELATQFPRELLNEIKKSINEKIGKNSEKSDFF